MKPTFTLSQMLNLIEGNECMKSLERLIELVQTQNYPEHHRLVIKAELNLQLNKLMK